MRSCVKFGLWMIIGYWWSDWGNLQDQKFAQDDRNKQERKNTPKKTKTQKQKQKQQQTETK